QAPIPVLLLREAGSKPVPSMFEGIGRLRVLVPLDGSPSAETALGPAAELAHALAGSEGAALHLLRVPETPARLVRAGLARAEALDAHALAAIRAEALAYLAEVAERLQATPLAGAALPVTWSVALREDPARAIVELAEDRAGMDTDAPEGAHAYSAIVMATHGRGGLQRLALGSVTERVVEGTRLPMLITRAQRTAEQ
ncbi:MAG TPA: universal stress protein, partial [Ktedonobacterales bacterium]|nr:universal stress protein [Ktedonobacterales bacterium]